jgi:hypothetical protein
MNPIGKVSCFLLFCLLINPILAPAAPPVVQMDGDRLTLRARDHDLSEILGLLADQGIRIRIDPRINPKITASFHKRPIGPAMASLLKSVDYALIWKKDTSSATGEPRLWEIRIFFKGQEARIRALREKADLIVVKKGDGDYHVKDILLLQLSPNITEVALAALLDRLGATIVDTYEPLGIVRLRLPHGSDVPSVADALANTPGVQTAEPDYAYPLENGAPEAGGTWSASAPPSQPPSSDATLIAVMDSGLLSDYEASPFVQSTFDAVSPGADVGDQLGHGTQMALIAAGAVNPMGTGTNAPAGSPVVAIRAFDDNGFTSTYTLMRGIDYAIENGARVVSLSWGTEAPSPLLASAVGYAAAKGLVLVAAAGNAPTGHPVYPAAFGSVIGVGALNPNGDVWDQSNFGDFVAVSAPGLADLPVGYKGEPGIYAGTSIATAYTARRVAAILNRSPDADQAAILRILAEGK